MWLTVPPCAVACVTGCGMHFALNLLLFLFLTWIGGIIHAICIVIIYGFSKRDMPRQRRKARLHAQQRDLSSASALSPPCYDTMPASATGFQDDHYAKNVYYVGRASSGSAFAQGSVNTNRVREYDPVMCPVDEAAPSSTDCCETPPVDTKESQKDHKFA